MAGATPLATYRLQLTKDFGFDAAASLAPYLKDLGISHLYASPFLKARPGSTHGYDVVDHDHLNPELGGEEAFARLSAALKANGLELILDFVPNHMGVGHSDNLWWLDVLEWGQKSPHAASFDIDWDALPHRHRPGVLLPILGRPYGEALEAGDITLKYDAAAGSFAAWYFDHKLPINPQRYSEMLRTIVGAADAEGDRAGHELIALAHDYRDPRTPSYRDAHKLKQRLAAIDGAAGIIERGLIAYRSDTENGAGALHRLLERQNYRLAHWRIAFSAVNYRRFFDITDLAGLRVEDPATFRAIHTLVARLIGSGQLQGLRLDHIDGLRDPAQYTRRLAALIAKQRREAGLPTPFYVIIEKILADGEPLPRLPGVDGTTGYEWLNAISRVLLDGRGLAPLDATWRAFSGVQADFPTILDAAKSRVIETILASEFTVLAGALSRIAAGHFTTRDFTLDRLRAALACYALEFPVYRTYVTTAGASEEDRRIIEQTIERARSRWRGPDPEIFDFLRAAVMLDLAQDNHYSAPRVRNFALKLQQFTGPLMAKAMEDTAFYRYHRLIALNEVGGDPALGELPLDEFHARQAARVETSPGGLTATATHDTKRGEDGRTRILALAELAGDWDAAVRGWGTGNERLAKADGSKRSPTRAHEYMIYQALIGAWAGEPDAGFVERMQAYALKAAREGKAETSWTNPDEAYEKALADFVAGLLNPELSAEFLKSFGDFAARTALIGALNSLSQLTLKATLPGVPDFYQGTEFWDLSLVDPDNRRPVNFHARREALRGEPVEWEALAQHWQDGRIKLFLTRALLGLRGRADALFRHGDYAPLDVAGPQAENVIAFSRQWNRQKIVVAVGRKFSALTDGGRRWPSHWNASVTLPHGEFSDALSQRPTRYVRQMATENVFRNIPVAVLMSSN